MAAKGLSPHEILHAWSQLSLYTVRISGYFVLTCRRLKPVLCAPRQFGGRGLGNTFMALRSTT